MTLASQVGLENKPTCPICPLCSSNETKPGREPAHSRLSEAAPLQGGLSASALISVVQVGGMSPF